MIRAEFKKTGDIFGGFRVSGHSGYSSAGSDIVCAAVTAMVQLTINAISDFFGSDARVSVDEESAEIDFSFDTKDERAALLASALYNELTAIQRDYPDNIRVIAK